MYKAIFFDLDGTLTESGEGITKSVQYALEKLGVSAPELEPLKVFVGPPLLEQFMKYAGFDKETAQKGIEYYRERYSEKGMYENTVYPGVENALASSYTGTYPVITGQDCDIANVKNMLSGKQAMSVFKDTRTLATQVVKMVDAVMQGGEAEINDSSSYDNGTGVIPTYLCEPVVVTADNYKEMLVDSGYYTEDQIK